MILTVVFGTLAAYLAYGFGYVAPRYVARQVAKNIERFPILADGPGQITSWRREAAVLSIPAALGWPLYLLGRALIDRIADTAPLTAHELKTLTDQQAKRIAELEAELGVGRKP